MKQLFIIASALALVLLSTAAFTHASSAQASVELTAASHQAVSTAVDEALRADLDFLFGTETSYQKICGSYFAWNASECNLFGCEEIGCAGSGHFVPFRQLCECDWAN